MTTVTPDIRRSAIILHRNGMPFQKIATRLGMTTQTVRYCIKSQEEETETISVPESKAERHGHGKPAKRTTERTRKTLKKYAAAVLEVRKPGSCIADIVRKYDLNYSCFEHHLRFYYPEILETRKANRRNNQ